MENKDIKIDVGCKGCNDPIKYKSELVQVQRDKIWIDYFCWKCFFKNLIKKE